MLPGLQGISTASQRKLFLCVLLLLPQLLLAVSLRHTHTAFVVVAHGGRRMHGRKQCANTYMPHHWQNHCYPSRCCAAPGSSRHARYIRTTARNARHHAPPTTFKIEAPPQPSCCEQQYIDASSPNAPANAQQHGITSRRAVLQGVGSLAASVAAGSAATLPAIQPAASAAALSAAATACPPATAAGGAVVGLAALRDPALNSGLATDAAARQALQACIFLSLGMMYARCECCRIGIVAAGLHLKLHQLVLPRHVLLLPPCLTTRDLLQL